MAGQTESLAPFLWPSLRADQASAWHGHVSFAHWVVQTARPNVIVELGTHNGVSYSAFCNSVQKNNLNTKCFAVDTWGGDIHAGFYGELVFENLSKFNQSRFSEFSTLKRCLFEEALADFADGSVDLLHIDGLHTYEAVRNDFETWFPKLSKRGIVLFHDIVIRERGFGVWQLWAELTQTYPHFSFDHSAGLGVLAVGSEQPSAISYLCSLVGSAAEKTSQQNFELASESARKSGLYDIEEARKTRMQQMQIRGKNIALDCAAFQSSADTDSTNTPAGAINGLKTGRFGFHTSHENNPWWMIDLGGIKKFDEIVVYNRLDSDCAARARDLVILASADGQSWQEFYRHDGSVFGGIDGFPLRITRSGSQTRFIRLKLLGHEYLHLDEVEIYDWGADAG